MGVGMNAIKSLRFVFEGGGLYFITRSDSKQRKRLSKSKQHKRKRKEIYDLSVVTVDLANHSLRWYRKKVLLIINMNRKCKYVN